MKQNQQTKKRKRFIVRKETRSGKDQSRYALKKARRLESDLIHFDCGQVPPYYDPDKVKGE